MKISRFPGVSNRNLNYIANFTFPISGTIRSCKKFKFSDGKIFFSNTNFNNGDKGKRIFSG